MLEGKLPLRAAHVEDGATAHISEHPPGDAEHRWQRRAAGRHLVTRTQPVGDFIPATRQQHQNIIDEGVLCSAACADNVARSGIENRAARGTGEILRDQSALRLRQSSHRDGFRHVARLHGSRSAGTAHIESGNTSDCRATRPGWSRGHYIGWPPRGRSRAASVAARLRTC